MYVISIVGAGILGYLFSFTGFAQGAAFGSGPAANAILMVFYLLFRDTPIYVFPLPIPIPTKYVVIFTAAIETVYSCSRVRFSMRCFCSDWSWVSRGTGYSGIAKALWALWKTAFLAYATPTIAGSAAAQGKSSKSTCVNTIKIDISTSMAITATRTLKTRKTMMNPGRRG
jgi:hypothetical protein